MKSTVSFIILSLMTFSLAGQSFYKLEKDKRLKLEASSLVSRSIYGQKVGFSVNLNINERVHINYFNLQAYYQNEATSRSFRGGQLRYMLNPRSRLSVGPSIKVGYHNKYFLNILPSVYSRYRALDKLAFGGGIAYSDGFPYFDFELVFTLFEK